MSKNFYYKGKFLEDENDFRNYVDRWLKTFLSEESLTEILYLLKKDILANLQFGCEITDGNMNSLLEKTFFEAMKLRKNLRECQEKE